MENLNIYWNGANATSLRFFEQAETANGNHFIAIQGPASVAASMTYTLPSQAPVGQGNAQDVLQSAINGTQSWSAVTGTGNVMRANQPAIGSLTFSAMSNLVSPAEGTIVLCTTCTPGPGTCTSGTGATFAIRAGNTWRCL